jgi:hypothetical protein
MAGIAAIVRTGVRYCKLRDHENTKFTKTRNLLYLKVFFVFSRFRGFVLIRNAGKNLPSRYAWGAVIPA